MRVLTGTTLLALLIPCLASAIGHAQNVDSYWTAPAPMPSDPLESDLIGLQQRLEQCERQMQSLEARLAQPAGQGAESANRFGLASQESAAPGEEEGPVKIEKVEIQTKPNYKFRGRLFFDHVMYTDDPALGLDRENETGFDTARLGMLGNIFENVKYQIELEFEGTEVDFKSTYIEVTELPGIGRFRAGYFYEPIAGLDEVSGSRYQMFMERSIAVTSYIPSRSFGYMAHRALCDENLYVAASTFRHQSDDSPTARGSVINDEGDWVFTGRVAWNPYYDEPSEGRHLVHLGLGYSYRTEPGGAEFHTVSELGNQGGYLRSTVPGDEDFSIFAPEFLLIWGRGSVQSESMFVPVGGANFWGTYVEASYFLTEGHRGYERWDKTITKPVLGEDFFSVRSPRGFVFGRGGLEAKVRWSHTDLREGTGATRGLQNNWTCGFNWYLNAYTRVMFDYVYEDVDLLTGAAGVNHGFGTRLQVHW